MKAFLNKVRGGKTWPSAESRGALLYATAAAFIGVNLLHTFATQAAVPGMTTARMIGIAALVPFVAAPTLYLATRKIGPAALILIVSAFIAATASATQHGGMPSPPALFLIVLPASAAMLLGRVHAAIALTAVAVAIGFLEYLTFNGLARPSPHTEEQLRLLSGSALFLSAGAVTFVVYSFERLASKFHAALLDVNAELEAKAAKLESGRRFLSAIMEAASDGIIAVDANGGTRLMNRAAREMLARPADDGAVANWRAGVKYLSADGGCELAAKDHPIARALLGAPSKAEMMIVADGGGDARIISLSASPLFNAENVARGAVALMRDITIEARQREEIVRQNEDFEQFARVAAHDLQSPLRAILARVDAAENATPRSDGSVKQNLGEIRDTAARMSELLRGMLALARMRGGSPDLHEVWPDECVEAALYSCGMSGASDIDIFVGKLPPVIANPMLLTQTYQNLITNAAKFVAKGVRPRIEFTAETETDHVVLGVKDNGIGIDPENLEKIFLPLERLNRREEYDGAGLGLAICQKALAKIGGEVWAESAPGEGAHFKIRLPAANIEKTNAA